MKKKKIILTICFLGILLLFSGCYSRINDYGIEALNWTNFKEISIGNSQNQLQVKYAKAIRHQFTVMKNENVYKLFYIYTASKPDIDHLSSIGLLCKNGELIKFIKPSSVKCKMEEVLYEGIPWRKRKSWEVDDNYSINSVLTLKGVNQNVFKRNLTDTTDYNDGMEPLKILPAFVITSILFVPQILKSRKQYSLNKQFLKKYDGSKINVGMSIDEVDKLYNEPQKIFHLKDNKEVRLYGSSTKLDLVYYRVRYSWFAVVFRNGRARKVLSDSFFNQDWTKGQNIEER